MTTIYMYAGCYAEIGSEILLASAKGADSPTYHPRAALAEAKAVIAKRNLTDVLILDRSGEVWADDTATARLYPEVGPLPKPYRSDREGSMRYQPVVASSAIRCHWDKSRYRMIDFSA